MLLYPQPKGPQTVIIRRVYHLYPATRWEIITSVYGGRPLSCEQVMVLPTSQSRVSKSRLRQPAEDDLCDQVEWEGHLWGVKNVTDTLCTLRMVWVVLVCFGCEGSIVVVLDCCYFLHCFSNDLLSFFSSFLLSFSPSLISNVRFTQ